MAEQFAGKMVPWSDLEKYLTVHNQSIVTFQDLLKGGIMTKAAIETLLPNSFWKIHEEVAKILKDNNIGPNEEESKVDQLQLIVKTVMKL